MKFLKYPSLTNHFAILKTKRFLKYIDKKSEFFNEKWYATEKLDGKNMSITIDLENFSWKAAQRSHFIERDKQVKQFSKIYEIIDDETVKNIAINVKKLFPTFNQIQIYGELFGGGTQKQNYDISGKHDPEIRFYDAFLDKENGHYQTLSLSELQEILPERFQEQVIKIDNLINLLSVTPDEKSLYGGDNEGYVYKLVSGVKDYLPEDELENKIAYTVVKHKTPKYSELKDARIHEKAPISDDVLSLNESMSNYVTIQRVRNVLSHGDVEPIKTNIGKLIKLVLDDVEEEYLRENDLIKISKADYNFVLKSINSEISLLVKKEILS